MRVPPSERCGRPGARHCDNLREHSQRVLISESAHDRSAITFDHRDPCWSEFVLHQVAFGLAFAGPNAGASMTVISREAACMAAARPSAASPSSRASMDVCSNSRNSRPL